MRSRASVEIIDGVVPDDAMAANRWFGETQGTAWIEQIKALIPHMARIGIQAEWAGILDFGRRFPIAMKRAMAA